MIISSKFKAIITLILLIASAFAFAGCEGFFASPQELFTDGTPTPVPKATDVIPTVVTVTNTSEATPTAEVKPTEGGVPSVTDTPTPVPTDTPVPTATPTPIPTVEAHPAEVNTDYRNSYTFIVDRAYPLPSTYEPDDLVPLSECALDYDSLTDPKHKMRKVAAEALTEMFNAAKEEDIHLVAVSGYRSFERQYTIYGHCLMVYSLKHTNRYSAVPGSSEHQTGLAMDLSCESAHNDLIDEFADTPEGQWVYEHCWEYGFIIRYTKGKTDITGYAFEPWHVRYVGVPLAYYLTQNGITLEEYYGVHDPYDEEYLSTHALIDTHTLKYHKLYASYSSAELILTAAGNGWEDPKTGYPRLVLPVKDAKGKNIKNAKGKLVYDVPLTNIFGEYYLNADGSVMMKEVLRDAAGNPVLDNDKNPIFLEPLVEGDGSFVRDASGKIVTRKLLTDSAGNLWLDENGRPIQLVPLRDDNTYLVYNESGELIYFTPFQNAEHWGDGTGQDYETKPDGSLFFSQWYYTAANIEKTIAITEAGVVPENK